MKRLLLPLALLTLLLAFLSPLIARADLSPADARAAYTKGNYKDAYDSLAPKVTSPTGTDQLSEDFTLCLTALNNLGRADEIDAFREKAIAAHSDNWHFLQTAAQSYRDQAHIGVIISGVFHRGMNRNGDGRWVNTLERDRLRSLQLMQQAVALLQKEKTPDTAKAADLYIQFALTLLQGNNGTDAFRLQELTDFAETPDYVDIAGPWYYRGYAYGSENRGAPVDASGNPVLHHLPKGDWATAKTDGERFRWLILQASELSPVESLHAKSIWAGFLQSQFGVQTMLQGGNPFASQNDDPNKTNESGPFAVATLKDDETIARLANGIKRFHLDDEFNPIKLFKDISASPDNTGKYAEHATDALASIYENRQQYNTSADWWKKSMARFGPGDNNFRQQRLDQIVGNWARFESSIVQPAGDTGAKFDLRFRNGNHVDFTATEIDVPALLKDVEAYIKTKPDEMPYDQTDIQSVGRRLLEDNPKYRLKEVAKWSIDLKPKADHFDARVSIQTPLKKPGAYLVSATMANGNTTHITAWVTDTVIVQKPMSGRVLTYVADAVTGAPIPNASVAFFGWKQQWLQDRKYLISTQNYSAATNPDGEIFINTNAIAYNQPDPPVDPANPVLDRDLEWLATATTKDGRFAYLGWEQNVWRQEMYDPYDREYNQVKAFVMTDRPVYRPEQTIHLKMWVGNNKYDEDGKNPHANEAISILVTNPRGETVKEFSGKLDSWGGIEDELTLSKDAPLGNYSISSPGHNGGTSFRLEEYKKPEFEVSVDAPTDPVQLGDTISATINAKYYFGSPVTNATVKYKVTRTDMSARWYPSAYWDWFYEPGYWWFAADYHWYPGFDHWATFRPIHSWWGGFSQSPPEVVADGEAPIGPDGTVKIKIDTAVAKAAFGDRDHRYSISAEVTDSSRRTITGSGDVLVARDPFKVYTWVDRGFYHTGDTVFADFSAQTLDNKPVAGKGSFKLLRIDYDAKGTPHETEILHQDLNTTAEGRANAKLKADQPGQYRLSYSVTDSKNRTIEGGYIFLIRGENFDGHSFRFNDIEITSDQKEYKAGEKVHLQISTERPDSTVLLFLRPSNGVYLEPKLIHITGKSAVEDVDVGLRDMPNFFVEAMTIADAKISNDVRELIVPPSDRVLNVTVASDKPEYKPGQKAKLTVSVTEKSGEPFTGTAVLSLYDKAVEYISGGSNIEDIRKFFWQWRRNHSVSQSTSLSKDSNQILRPGAIGMADLGIYGYLTTEFDLADREMQQQAAEFGFNRRAMGGRGGGFGGGGGFDGDASFAFADSKAEGAVDALKALPASAPAPGGALGVESAADVTPTVRSNFADTAAWFPTLLTAKDGTASVEVPMPENLTTWKARLWTFGDGSRVGQGDTEIITRKNLIVRLEAPRFFTQTDDVLLSAIVHNYLKTAKRVKVNLDLAGGALENRDGLRIAPGAASHSTQSADIQVPANGEKRVDFWVHAANEGTANITMSALTDEESDAMAMSIPVYVHGMLKTDSFAGALRPDKDNPLATVRSNFTIAVPHERRPDQTLLEVRYSPSLASAMVDALPYMVSYPYGCTEQTLDRFLPTVITQKILTDMHLDLAAIKNKRTNLNAAEIGNAQDRAAQWNRNFAIWKSNPVFDIATVKDMVRDGIDHLQNQQLSDGGWGWFSGSFEVSTPHETAFVVHGLQQAKAYGADVNQQVLDRGIQWLVNDQAKRLAFIQEKREERKSDNIDAFEYMVLADASRDNTTMRAFLFEDRTNLSVYAKAMFGLALQKLNDKEKLQAILQNCNQYVVQDDENQTAYLKLPPDGWWFWYGSEFEAHAYYLKLLSATDPKGDLASRFAKYLINNRKNATYWNSTRDTAICIEALADYIKASGETAPDMTVHIALDGKEVKSERITAENLFSFDNRFAIEGAALADGKHALEVSREGTGPLYFSSYLTNFTMEPHITRAGLEIKVNRKVYLLTRDDKNVNVEGQTGQLVSQRLEKYKRTELTEGQSVESGDLVEVELTVDSKNDYEYILLEDMKAAGFEPVGTQSGYNGNDMRAYVEYRDNRVAFFVRELGRGTHSVSYRLRAETPGAFSALPTRATALYAPELRANSDEIKLQITDQPAK